MDMIIPTEKLIKYDDLKNTEFSG